MLKEDGGWLNRNVLFIALSAFFADLGYQAIIAGFPIFLVIVLGAPVYIFGVVAALQYGIGSIFNYAGGVLSDRLGKKRVAIAGNSLIPLMSLSALFSSVLSAIGFYSVGWWARDFRSGARRSMLADSTKKGDMSKAFGFLHMLDVGGGIVAVLVLLYLVGMHLPFRIIFLLTAIPLVVSTLFLALVREVKARKSDLKKAPSGPSDGKSATYGVLMAAALYGFGYYNLGFPILTIAKSSNSLQLGILSYAIFLGVSSIAGYLAGILGSKSRKAVSIAFFGYLLSAAGSFLLGASYLLGLGIIPMYLSIAAIGGAVGVIETFEPTIVSLANGSGGRGRWLGSLAASRSIGFFTGNLVMGLLYMVTPFYAYSYASITALAAFAVILLFGRRFKG